MLKRFIKKRFPANYWHFLSWYKAVFGLFPALARIYELLTKGIGSAPNPLTGGRVYLRPGTADHDVYDEVFIYNEYAIDLGLPTVILDIGAHIGLSAVYFAARYPHAQVIALEPEVSNYSMLVRNSNSFPNIIPINRGLWNKCTKLLLEDSSVDTWSYRFIESASDSAIPAVSVPDLIKEFNLTSIDVLKLDIEGAEIEVLSDSSNWMGLVNTLVIELHDRFRPGCSDVFEASLINYEYERVYSGENIVIKNIKRKIH